VFCIGMNKTGTTSMEGALTEFGYRMGPQTEHVQYVEDWAVRDFRRVVQFCQSYDAFQDVPFSLDYTYQALDAAFPGSQFVLTVRHSAQEWFESLTRFHKKLFRANGELTVADLRRSPHPILGTGFHWRLLQLVLNSTEDRIYDRDSLMHMYEEHNRQAIEYFRWRPNDLLVLNLAEGNSMGRLCDFLGIKPTVTTMPHLNKSA
jgi:hypothetical protein